MQKPIYSNKLLSVALVIALLIALLWHYTDTNDSSPKNSGKPLEQEITDTTHQPNLADQPSSTKDRSTDQVMWKVGKPSPLIPVIRGENKQRQFGTPKTSKLPDQIENSAPSILAMIPADGRNHLLPEETDQYTLKSRRMVLDTAALDRVLAGETNHIIAPTPGAEVLDLKIESIRTRSKQTHTLVGKIAGEELSDVNIVYHDGIIYAAISRYNKDQHFEYRILADGYMMVREIDAPAVPQGCVDPGPSPDDAGHTCDTNCKHDAAASPEETQAPAPTTEPGPTVEADTSGWTTIDVVVGYGTQARIAEGGISQIEARIIASVDQMTASFANSLVTNTEMMLLGTIEDPDYVYPGAISGDMGTPDELGDLDDTSGSNSALNTVSNYSALLGADLTSFICKDSQGGTAGIAYRPGKSSIVARTALFPSITFAHELGHNLGAKHSWGDAGDTTINTSRFGLRFAGSGGTRYRTIMAYSETYGGSRIPHYANPNVNYDGTPTGLATGSNQTGNTKIDPAYISGGFDGSNPNLGARNAEMLMVQEGSNGVAYASTRRTRTALSVTSPVAAVSWAAGSTQTVTFTGGDMDYTADIDLYKGGVYQFTIANDIDAIDHSYTWNIPLAQEGGNNFKIRVTLTHTDTLATSYTESGFFVIQGTTDIILESPIGGETWTRNSKKNITWSSSYGGNVKIEYIKGVAAPVTIVSSAPDDGSYEWTIPYNFVLGTDYKIKITSDVSPFDNSQSAATFTIVAPSNNLLVTNLDSDPGFTTSGEFQYGAPGGTNDASTTHTGSNMYDTNLTDTSYNTSTLTTYAIDCSSHTNVTLEFWSHIYLYSGYSAVFEVSNDNSNWTELFSAAGYSARSWTKYTYDISSVADGNSTVYVRWSVVGSGTQWTGGGMAIDDISITGDFIPADGFSVITPNSGEIITASTLNQITWLSGLGGNAKIELIKNGSVQSTIATNTPNDGLFYWFVPGAQPAGADYKIRITSVENGTRQGENASNFTISAPTSTIYSNTLETDPSFTMSGEFEYGSPSGTNKPAAAHSGTKMYDTVLASTAYYTGFLKSTAIDCSNYQNVSLQFWSHFYFTSYYQAVFEVSNDNITWNNLYTSSGAITNSSWVQRTYDISAWANRQSTVYIRWSMNNPTSYYSQYGGGGMAIDDITLTGDFVPALPTYDTWAKGPQATADTNGDGIKNGVAWVLGAANPAANATSLQPSLDNTSDPNYLIFTYRRTDEASNDPNTTIGIEYGSNLTSWAPADHDNNNIVITESNDFYGTGVDRVQVKLKRTLASGNRLFCRLKVNLTE